MNIKLLSITPNIETVIEEAGRTCYQSYNKISEGSAERFIKMIIKNGHESVLEHGYASFKISGISRSLSHQLVRHRIASFSQQSQRYCKEDQFDYVIPPSVRDKYVGDESSLLFQYQEMMRNIQDLYNRMVREGIKPEDARFVLPNACCTQLVLTCNLREWRHIFKERYNLAAQWEIRQMCKEILKVLKPLAPIVFADFKIGD
jgi:thymidylate synthase (FAD)